MKHWIFASGLLVCFCCSSLPAESRGMGKFLGSMLARGAVNAAVHSGTSSSSSASSSSSMPSTSMPPTKTYPADVLTVAQLAQCLKGAATLDETNERLEVDRTALRSSVSDVDQSKAAIEPQRSN